jgi:hypothetical protein
LNTSGNEPKRSSEFPNEVASANTQSFRNPQQGVKADPLFAPFNFANINGMQFGFFRQPFLAHTGLNTALPDS